VNACSRCGLERLETAAAPGMVHYPVERVHVNENEDPAMGRKLLTPLPSAEYTAQAVLRIVNLPQRTPKAGGPDTLGGQ
jgi:hypothetical protein